MEIERKYIVATVPDLTGVLSKDITQGYLAVDDTHEVRIRKKGPDYKLTVKVGTGLRRQEHETALSEKQFNQLWPAVGGRTVNKVRYYLPNDICIDIYSGHLARLVVAEIEFNTIEESSSFVPPDWFGPDVTLDIRFKNRALASAVSIPLYLA